MFTAMRGERSSFETSHRGGPIRRRPIAGRLLSAAGIVVAGCLVLQSCASDDPPNYVELAVIAGFATVYEDLPSVNDSHLNKAVNRTGSAGECEDPLPEAIQTIHKISAETPSHARFAVRAILQAVLACDVRVSDVPSVIGCIDIGTAYTAPEEYEHTWPVHANHRYLSRYATETMPAIFEGMFAACLASAAAQSYAELGIEAPAYFPTAMLFETWVEMCGDGQRSYSEFRWRSGFFSSSGAGAASASSTDLLLLSAFTDAGSETSEAIDALVTSYQDHNVHCPVVMAPAVSPSDVLPAS